MTLRWHSLLSLFFCLCGAEAFTVAWSRARPSPATSQLRGSTRGELSSSGAPSSTCFAAAVAAGLFGVWKSRPGKTSLQGLKDRVRKEFSVKSAMIRRLGKWRLMKEFDMRSQIMEDPMIAKRSGKTQEELIAEFNVASNYLKDLFGMTDQVAEICISKVATGLNMQFLGRPQIPSNEQMQAVLDWVCDNLAVKKEDGSLKSFVEQYPFVLGRTMDELEESIHFCPEDIDYAVAVAEDPALIDKTFNCQGICQNQCIACWYDG